MFVLVRDEDPETVASAITTIAVEEGLEPLDLQARVQNPLAALSILSGPHAVISATNGQVLVVGLESLDIAEPEEWGEQISRACQSEVLAVEPAEDGIRIYVFDGGELEDTIEVPIHASGRTRVPALVDLTDSEEGKKALEKGIVARSVDQLLPGVLKALGVDPDPANASTVAFVDPLGEQEEELPAGILVDGLGDLDGVVGGNVSAPSPHVFSISIQGIPSIDGLDLELSGSALELTSIDRIDVWMRRRGGHQQEHRALASIVENGVMRVALSDAHLESASAGSPTFDANDLFATMQQMMSANESLVLNTVLLQLTGVGKKAGEGELSLRASTAAEGMEPGVGTVSVRVR